MNKEIISNLKEQFRKSYGKGPDIISRAPGRLEILGNHTDYNEGLVLSTAVEQSTYFAIAKNNSEKFRIFSQQISSKPEEFAFDDINQKIPGDWKNYIKGIICEIRKRGHEIIPFDAAIASDLPLSSGMSSSAAIEVASCLALEKFLNINFTKIERAEIGQAAENNFVGAKTGLLDQFSSVFGKSNCLILCDFRKKEVLRNVPLAPEHSIVVVNSMIKHNLVDSEYNARRKSCENVVSIIAKNNKNVKALRDLSPEQLLSYKDLIPIFDFRKALHVVEENDRVAKAVEALDNGDCKYFGKLLLESHYSSRFNFENSCPELDYLIELSQSIPGCVGARLSGGGFGGISIHLVADNETENYLRRIKTAFKIKFGITPETIICKAGDGAEWITKN